MKDKKLTIQGALLIIFPFLIGAITGYFLPHTYHGKTAEQIAKTVDYYGRLHLSDQNKIAGQEAQIKQLQNRPTPTPEIIYKTQYQTQYVPQIIPVVGSAPGIGSWLPNLPN